MFYFHYQEYLKPNYRTAKRIVLEYRTKTINQIHETKNIKAGKRSIVIVLKNLAMDIQKPYVPTGHPDTWKLIEFLKMDRSIRWYYKEDAYKTARTYGYLSIMQFIWDLYKYHSSSEIAKIFEKTPVWVTQHLRLFNMPIRGKGGNNRKKSKQISRIQKRLACGA